MTEFVSLGLIVLVVIVLLGSAGELRRVSPLGGRWYALSEAQPPVAHIIDNGQTVTVTINDVPKMLIKLKDDEFTGVDFDKMYASENDPILIGYHQKTATLTVLIAISENQALKWDYKRKK